jgi:predicted alpha/beta-hydrolase family hydrolase
MNSTIAQPLKIQVDSNVAVSALLQTPANDPLALYVFAHGAGAGMNHSFMSDFSDALVARGIATLRYQFPYMELGSGRPDAPALCHATVRAAVSEARRIAPQRCIVAGGKSFGGRMTSQAQAAANLEGVRGLAFVGFPLHAPKKPADSRGAHLSKIQIPMLFLQGTRDELADLTLLTPLVKKLGPHATLRIIDSADHGFHVLKRSGRNDREVMDELADSLAEWVTSLLG